MEPIPDRLRGFGKRLAQYSDAAELMPFGLAPWRNSTANSPANPACKIYVRSNFLHNLEGLVPAIAHVARTARSTRVVGG
jgi:hypothetical protein